MESSTLPVIAFAAIYDKQNKPVLVRNYICDHLQNSPGFDSMDCENLRMQMAMLVYSTLDIFDEK